MAEDRAAARTENARRKSSVRRRVSLKVIKPATDTTGVIALFGQGRQALALMERPDIAGGLDVVHASAPN
jgi:hypothetical protein